VRETVMTQTSRDALRRLVVAWILHSPSKNESVLQRRLNLISSLSLREAIGLPLDVATKAEPYAEVQPINRAEAILVIGQYGEAKHADKLEPLLQDSTVCMPLQAPQPGQPMANVQIRDVALAVMLHLSGQRPQDYGFARARLHPQQKFVLESLHCESDEKRAEALAKWQAFRAQKRRDAKKPG
jgi:hypothetical protein